MDHQDIRRELAARAGMLLAPDAALPKPLRPYQAEAAANIRRWLDDPGGTRRGHVVHATGLGKTVLFASLLRYCAGLRALVIVPSKVLIEQTARVVAGFVGGPVGHLSSLQVIRDEDGEVVAMRGLDHHAIVITTDATLRLSPHRLASRFNPHLIIRDECHWGYSERSQLALEHFPDAVVIGFTATPDYLGTAAKPDYVPVTLDGGQVLYGNPDRFASTHFGTCLDTRTARWGMENGWLAPLAWAHIEFGESLNAVPVKEGPGGMDYDEGALQRLMRQRWDVTCETVRRLYRDPAYGLPDRQVFAICPGVAAAMELTQTLSREGIAAAHVTGDTEDHKRRILLEAFNARDVSFLASVLVLREGWDAPEAEVCLMLRPTKSRLFYEQGLGRVLRPYEDGRPKVALAVDLHFQNTTFSPLSAPLVYGVPGEAIKERDIVVRPDDADGPLPSSPYLPDGVEPKLHVVPALEIEHWAAMDGTFTADGLLWAGLDALTGLFNETLRSMWHLIFQSRRNRKRIRERMGRLGGRSETFHCVQDLETALGRRADRARIGIK